MKMFKLYFYDISLCRSGPVIGNWNTLYVVYKPLFQSPAEGAQPVLFCALEDLVEPGGYYMDCRLYDHTLWVPKSAYDEGLAKKLWESTERILTDCG